MQISFVGPSYVYASRSFDCQRSINLYPVKSETGTSKNLVGLQGTPGKVAFSNVVSEGARGAINVNGRVFWVFANTLYETYIDGTFTARGTISSTSGAVGIETNGLQICIVDGPNGYIFTLATNVLVQITDPYFLGSDTVAFLDGYFVFQRPDTQIYYISALYDGLTGDPLDFASAEGSPDNLVAVKTVHQQCFLLGETTVQIVTNTGGADFPLTTVQGSLIQYGCIAPYSVCTSANTIFWVGQDGDGTGVVWSTSGYAPQRISTHAIEEYLQRYASELPNATAFTYQEQGVYFYVVSVPTMPTSLAYDVALGQWHERAYFSDGEYSRDRAVCHVAAYGKHLVGDYANGMIYQQALDIYSDNGQVIRRERILPHNAEPSELDFIYYSALQIDMQVGIGINGAFEGGAFNDGFSFGFDVGTEQPQNVDPQMMLQWSNDGGYTWSSEYWVSAGRMGEYLSRVMWRRLGRARDRVFKVATTAKCKIFMIAAHAQLEKGSN